MPLSPVGKRIKKKMQKEYGSEKGESVFYAMENKGTLTPRALKKGRVHDKKGGKCA